MEINVLAAMRRREQPRPEARELPSSNTIVTLRDELRYIDRREKEVEVEKAQRRDETTRLKEHAQFLHEKEKTRSVLNRQEEKQRVIRKAKQSSLKRISRVVAHKTRLEKENEVLRQRVVELSLLQGRRNGDEEKMPSIATRASPECEKEAATKANEREQRLKEREERVASVEQRVAEEQDSLTLQKSENEHQQARLKMSIRDLNSDRARLLAKERELDEREVAISQREKEIVTREKQVEVERRIVASLRGKCRLQDAELIVKLATVKDEERCCKEKQIRLETELKTAERAKLNADALAETLKRQAEDVHRKYEVHLTELAKREDLLQERVKQGNDREKRLREKEEHLLRREHRILAFAADVEKQTGELKKRELALMHIASLSSATESLPVTSSATAAAVTAAATTSPTDSRLDRANGGEQA